MFNLPKDFTPIEKVVLCGNTINNGMLFSYLGDYLFAIGKTSSNEKPGIWISTVVKNSKNEVSVIHLLENSKSVNKVIKVFNSDNEIAVLANGQLILDAKFHDDLSCEVQTINFKPIGLIVEGDSAKLTIGKSNFLNSRITVNENSVAFSLGI